MTYQPFTSVFLRRLGYQPTRLREILKTAELFGVSQNQAIGARRAYLWKEWDWYLNADVDVLTWDVICKPMILTILDEIDALKRSMRYRIKENKADITDDMIQNARGCPVTSLIDLSKGQARCLNPDHPDERPSMYLAKRINKVICGSCNWRGDAIDVFMAINKVTFHQAVKALCSMG